MLAMVLVLESGASHQHCSVKQSKFRCVEIAKIKIQAVKIFAVFVANKGSHSPTRLYYRVSRPQGFDEVCNGRRLDRRIEIEAKTPGTVLERA